MKKEQLKGVTQSIPAQPGVYKFYNENNQLIYVGKAKNLRKRVASYFSKTHHSYKTHELVKRIEWIEFAIVNSEQDAFLLENSLIKEFQPRYNIHLKDDKSYPYIVIKNEPFPRVFFTRRVIADGSEYLGPYTSVQKVKELLDFITRTIPLRTCSLNLTDKNIQKRKFKVCLEYHLGNCKGPCEALQSKEDYNENISQVKNILRGNLTPVLRHFKKEMKEYAATLQFEKAEQVKKKIEFLKNYQARSVIVSRKPINADVFSLVQDKNHAFVNYLMIRNGTIVQTHTTEAETQLDERPAEILAFSIARLRRTFNSDAAEIIVPVKISFPESNVIITVPKGGGKKKLLELSEKNAGYFMEELKRKEKLKTGVKETDMRTVLNQLQQNLQLPALPVHIECFDNSNLQGSYPVAAMVCFRNGRPDKKNYRLFNIKTVQGINDVASMKEVVFRRYKKLLQENQPFPQLIIIDGGKGQLHAALEALDELNARQKTTVAGLAKNQEELFFAGDKQSLKLPYDSSSLKLIRRIRDEVHRFGLTFHQKKRSKGALINELETIPGIGKSTAARLLKELKSVKKIRELHQSELEKIIGKSKAALLEKYFNNNPVQAL
jgi:excinuclease ABC subunit C